MRHGAEDDQQASTEADAQRKVVTGAAAVAEMAAMERAAKRQQLAKAKRS